MDGAGDDFEGDQIDSFKEWDQDVGKGQVSSVVKASYLGLQGPRFDPWQQHLVQMLEPSKRWRGGHVTKLARN